MFLREIYVKKKSETGKKIPELKDTPPLPIASQQEKEPVKDNIPAKPTVSIQVYLPPISSLSFPFSTTLAPVHQTPFTYCSVCP